MSDPTDDQADDQADDQRQAGATPGATPDSPFDAIRHTAADGAEYWSARELAKLLGYRRWEAFPGVVAKAQEACEVSGYAVSDHFREAPKLITAGKGAQRSLQDWELSRYACYLIVQNADPEKPIVALGQTYFAVQTRRQELADERLLQGMSEDQRRLFVRSQLAEHNRSLADAAASAGVIANDRENRMAVGICDATAESRSGKTPSSQSRQSPLAFPTLQQARRSHLDGSLRSHRCRATTRRHRREEIRGDERDRRTQHAAHADAGRRLECAGPRHVQQASQAGCRRHMAWQTTDTRY